MYYRVIYAQQFVKFLVVEFCCHAQQFVKFVVVELCCHAQQFVKFVKFVVEKNSFCVDMNLV